MRQAATLSLICPHRQVRAAPLRDRGGVPLGYPLTVFLRPHLATPVPNGIGPGRMTRAVPSGFFGSSAQTGGEGGIRTLEGLAPLTVFETATIGHSVTSPRVFLHEVTWATQVERLREDLVSRSRRISCWNRAGVGGALTKLQQWHD